MNISARLLDIPQLLVAYLATAAVFLALDFLWLTNMTASFYRPRLGGLLLEQPNLSAAAIFYLFYAAGVVYFAVTPALHAGSWTLALINGFILGALAYGAYDITNYATLRGWSGAVTLVDIAWGCCVTAVSALAGFGAVRILGLLGHIR